MSAAEHERADGLPDALRDALREALGPPELDPDSSSWARIVARTDALPGDLVPPDPLPADPLPGDPLPGDPLPRDPLPRDPLPRDPLPGDPLPGDPLPGDPLLNAALRGAFADDAPARPSPQTWTAIERQITQHASAESRRSRRWVTRAGIVSVAATVLLTIGVSLPNGKGGFTGASAQALFADARASLLTASAAVRLSVDASVNIDVLPGPTGRLRFRQAGCGRVDGTDRTALRWQAARIDAAAVLQPDEAPVPFEDIVIGTSRFRREADGAWTEVEDEPSLRLLAPQQVSTLLDSAGSITELEREKIDGATTRHFRFRLRDDQLDTTSTFGAALPTDLDVWIDEDRTARRVRINTKGRGTLPAPGNWELTAQIDFEQRDSLPAIEAPTVGSRGALVRCD